MRLQDYFQKLANGQPLSESEKEEFVRIGKQLDMDSARFNKYFGIDGSLRVKDVYLDSLTPSSPVSRLVSYYVSAVPVTVPNNTYVYIEYNGTVFGAGDNPLAQACVVKVPGYDDRFTLNSNIAPLTPIHFWGDFAFDANATGSREIAVEFFDATDTSLGAYSFDQRASAAAGFWTTVTWDFVDTFDLGDYVKISAYQDSGSSLTLMQTDANFALG